MKKIYNLSFITAARKYELPEIVKSVTDIVEKHNPEALGINGMFVLLKNKLPGLSIITVQTELGKPKTTELDALRKRMQNVVMGLRTQCKALELAGMANTQQQLSVVWPVISRYTYNLRKANQTEKSARLQQLLTELNSETLKTALNDLGLSIYVLELEALLMDVFTASQTNLTSVTQRNRSQMQVIKAGLFDAVRNMVQAIELAIVEHPDKDYSLLVEELNNYFSNLSAIMKARRTRRMNSIKRETVAETPTSIATAN